MMRRGGMRDAGGPRRRAQGQRLDAVALQDRLRRAEQRRAEVAVVIGGRPRAPPPDGPVHAYFYTGKIRIDKSGARSYAYLVTV